MKTASDVGRPTDFSEELNCPNFVLLHPRKHHEITAAAAEAVKQDSIEGASSSLLTSSAASLNRPGVAAPQRPPLPDDDTYREYRD